MNTQLQLLLILLSLLPTNAYIITDEVKSLPGFPHKLTSKLYSGYLHYDLGGVQVSTHYVYVEQDRQGRKANDFDDDDDDDRCGKKKDEDKLIFWSNGGPGASSLFGLLTEIGPYSFTSSSLSTPSYHKTQIPTLSPNEYAWNKFGDSLIFDAPAPVGYSFCNNDASGGANSCGSWNDTLAADNNYVALLSFYKKYPEVKHKSLYLTGESYAGIYIPMLAAKIIDSISLTGIKLKGFSVGDACTGLDVNCQRWSGGNIGPWFDLLFMHGHGQLSTLTFDRLLDECGVDALKFKPEAGYGYAEECGKVIDGVEKEVGGYYVYGLYDECTYTDNLLSTKSRRRLSLSEGEDFRGNNNRGRGRGRGSVTPGYPCGLNAALVEYVNHPTVKKALNVPGNANFYSGDDEGGFDYTWTERNLMPFYKSLAVGKHSHLNLRVQVYNGDTDVGINIFSTQNWTSSLNLPVLESWRPWTTDGCRMMGGYVTRYEGLDFVSVRGAGHMVPTMTPGKGFEMMKRWIQNEELQYYDPDCDFPAVQTQSEL